MKRFKNILVVFDSKTDNRALLDQAVDLAQRNQAALMVVDVIEETPHVLAKPIWREKAGEVQEPNIHILKNSLMKHLNNRRLIHRWAVGKVWPVQLKNQQ